ncbi:MAG: BF3164 family lipoprotein [Roseivirga sp.]
MKLSINWVCIVLLAFSSAGCSGEKYPKDNDSIEALSFGKTAALNGEQILENELSYIIETAGDYVLLEQDSKDTSQNVYHVYDAKDLSFLGAIGKRGQGPGEFYGAQYADQHYKEGDDTFIWVNDAPQYRITSINVTESLRSGQTVYGRVIKHHPKYNFQNTLFVVGTSDLIGYQPGFLPNTNEYPLHVLKGGASLSELRSGNESWTDMGEYPKVNGLDLIPNGEKYSAIFRRADIAMKPDQTRFVVAMKYYDRLDIFKRNGDLVESVRDPERYKEYNAAEVYDPETMVKVKDRFDYYQNVVGTDNYIYALYYNRNMGELNDEMGEAVEIRVFDWDGEPMFLLKCPDNLLLISVDEKNGFIYGHVEDEQKFMRYSLEGIL